MSALKITVGDMIEVPNRTGGTDLYHVAGIYLGALSSDSLVEIAPLTLSKGSDGPKPMNGMVPRRMWASESGTVHRTKEAPWSRPVLVIDLSPESVEAMAAEAAKAMYVNECRYQRDALTWDTTFEVIKTAYLKDAKAALTALGIKPVKKGGLK